jgi:hypothetical protein
VKRRNGIGESRRFGCRQFKQLPVTLLGTARRMTHQPGRQQPLFDEVILETLLNRNGHHTLPASLICLRGENSTPAAKAARSEANSQICHG